MTAGLTNTNAVALKAKFQSSESSNGPEAALRCVDALNSTMLRCLERCQLKLRFFNGRVWLPYNRRPVYHAPTMGKSKIPVLPTSPISLKCPFCGAKPKHDCFTSSGTFSAIHVARIKAAARMDKAKRL